MRVRTAPRGLPASDSAAHGGAMPLDPGQARRAPALTPALLLARALCLILLLVVATLAIAVARGSQARDTTVAGAAGWTLLPTSSAAPPPRGQFGMAADASGDIYIYGGAGADGTALSDVWVLPHGATTWTAIANTVAPALIEPHLAVDGAGNVYEFGGIGNPTGHHFSYDGHSFGLYQYQPTHHAWYDLTPSDVEPGITWPGGREDFGFGYDPTHDQLVVFAGSGNGDMSLNDLWTYDLATARWSQIAQHYDAPGGASIDPREIYNISYDGRGGFYLFGGSYLSAAPTVPPPPLYVNDLWRFDTATATWTLLAGRPNDYDPTMPLPRHYYAQTCDAAGNFYILDGYVSDTRDPPFFQNSAYAASARPVTLDGKTIDGITQYAIADFWQYNAATQGWVDLRGSMGDLTAQPAVPYNMVLDAPDNRLVTFGGFHPAGATLLRGNATWTYSLAPALPTATPSPPPPTAPSDTATATPTAALAAGSPTPTPSATPSASALPTAASGHAQASRISSSFHTTQGAAMPPASAPGAMQPGDDANPPRPGDA